MFEIWPEAIWNIVFNKRAKDRVLLNHPYVSFTRVDERWKEQPKARPEEESHRHRNRHRRWQRRHQPRVNPEPLHHHLRHQTGAVQHKKRRHLPCRRRPLTRHIEEHQLVHHRRHQKRRRHSGERGPPASK